MKIYRVLVAMLFLLLANFSVEAQAAGDHNAAMTSEAKVDRLFAQWNKPDSPGCALAVIKDGKVIYQRGYGMANLEQKVPIASDTAFYICSTSKQFTAMSIALLAEQGIVSLDDDIRKYLPEIPAYQRPITLRHLVHHTSGLRDYLMLWSLSGRDFADSIGEAEAIALIARQKALNFAPGDEYLYSNSGYFLLSVIVKRASGKSLAAFAEEHLFKPLGMRNTHFHDDRSRLIPKRADGHMPRAGGAFSLVKTSFDLVGDGGLYTTTNDLVLWDQNFYQNRLGKRGQRLLDEVLTKSKLNNGKDHFYAFGLAVNEYRGLRMIDHAGAFIGFRAEMIRFPDEKFSVIVLSNLGTVNADVLARRVADIYLADKLKGEAEKPMSQSGPAMSSQGAQATVGLSPEKLAEFAGDYYSPELDVVYAVGVQGEKLAVKIRQNPPVLCTQSGTDQFSAWQSRIVFARDAQGRVTGFALNAGRVRDLKFERK